MNNLTCIDSSATLWGIFDPSIAPTMLYYSYIPVIIAAIGLGVFINLQKSNNKLAQRIFLALTFVYSLLLINEIIQWIAVPAGIINFSWQLIIILYASVTALLLLFNISYITGKAPNKLIYTIFITSFIPILFFLPTKLNIVHLNLVECHGQTGLLLYYVYALMVIAIIALLYLLIKNRNKIEYIILTTSSILTIATILFADIISEHFWFAEFNLVGPIGMLLLICGMAYMMAELKAFESEVALAQFLVIGITMLIISEIFVVQSRIELTLVTITGTLSTIGGFLLIRSVNKEIRLREKNEHLVKTLEKANTRLQQMDKLKSEFVSIASHQLRSPITAISGYASLISEGSYGEVPEKMKDPIERIVQSARMMATSIEDYLNVSRIEAGNMKYSYSDFNISDEAEHICDDLRPEAFKRGLVLLFRKRLSGKGIVNADVGKVQQIIHNLINNSIKYTPKGAITVYVRDNLETKKIYVDIMDTGIGMNEETKHSIFQKFERGDKANTVNVKGTGLGLYVALKMAEAMKGTITAHSDGEGKGSRFTIELPLAM